jgi:molybdopterin-containing oxidoreductase family membrane subunit
VGLFNFLLFIPLLWALPITDGRRSIWFEWPGHSPHLWDTLALGLLVVCGLALLYFASLPDLAAVRDHSTGGRQGMYRRLALNWQGSPHQWRVLQAGVSILGGFYFMFLIFVHTLISVDFAMSLVPGWKDAIFPAFHALNGLQSAVALTLVTMFILRWKGGLKGYLEVDQFWGLSKLLLALSLLWFYFWWSGFYTYWYGRTPAEQSILKLLMFETYKVPFFLAFALCFVVPFVILMWNVVRKTTWGPALAGAIVLVGTFFNMIRFYVPAFSVQDSTLHALETVPPTHTPGGVDVLVVLGALAGAVLAYMMATRLFPVISIWEMKEGMLLQRVRGFMKIEIKVLAKPE